MKRIQIEETEQPLVLPLSLSLSLCLEESPRDQGRQRADWRATLRIGAAII